MATVCENISSEVIRETLSGAIQYSEACLCLSIAPSLETDHFQTFQDHQNKYIYQTYLNFPHKAAANVLSAKQPDIDLQTLWYRIPLVVVVKGLAGISRKINPPFTSCICAIRTQTS